MVGEAIEAAVELAKIGANSFKDQTEKKNDLQL